MQIKKKEILRPTLLTDQRSEGEKINTQEVKHEGIFSDLRVGKAFLR